MLLIGLQVLNSWFFAAVAGIGLTLFQQIIPRPGLATGLYMNTRRVGAIVSGPIIAIGSMSARGYRGIFAVCAALTVVALVVIWAASRTTSRRQSETDSASRWRADIRYRRLVEGVPDRDTVVPQMVELP